MPPKAPLKVGKKKVKLADKKKGRQAIVEDDRDTDNLEDDADLLNMDQNNAMGGID